MVIKFFFILLLCQIIFSDIDAQRVKRKGVNPVEVSSTRIAVKYPVFTLDKFLGKWQEVIRTENHNPPLVFSDTIFLDFRAIDNVTIRQTNHVTYKGAAEIVAPGNVLLLSADIFTIISISDNEMVLDNQENIIHTLKKTNQFWYETFGKNTTR
jgi:hypothetical protein